MTKKGTLGDRVVADLPGMTALSLAGGSTGLAT